MSIVVARCPDSAYSLSQMRRTERGTEGETMATDGGVIMQAARTYVSEFGDAEPTAGWLTEAWEIDSVAGHTDRDCASYCLAVREAILIARDERVQS
jgi:hypothetical protein